MYSTKRQAKMHKAYAPVVKRKGHRPEWLIGQKMMDHAVKAIRARAHIERGYDIPYLAGYSLDGHTIFIDRHMPKNFVYRNRKVLTDRFLIVHEAVEKSLIQLLGMHYLTAHQIALHAEQAAVRAEGITWEAYDDFMQDYIKVIGDEALSKVPDNLDLTPYVDFHDAEELKKMRAGMAHCENFAPKHKVHIAGLS
ncbi:MAG: hypothetical protein E6K53_05985 [Gammaproteobacteria bacterium]|nr:MAG: hypothetical protein E6K53_05985 [Gammaproteobacteria bacterium]